MLDLASQSVACIDRGEASASAGEESQKTKVL